MQSRILVVDDDEVLGSVLRRVLGTFGYTVEWAGTIAQAREVARGFRPHTALLDLCLPDGNGIALGRELRAEHPPIALVLMTASPLPSHGDPIGTADFAAVLAKPFDLNELRETLQLCSLSRNDLCTLHSEMR